jgi:PatG C-terminal
MEPQDEATANVDQQIPLGSLTSAAEGLSPAQAMADMPLSYIYAIGRIQPRFPTLGVEKELAQIIGMTDTKGMTDRATLHAALTEKANRYVARKLCWVLSIEGLDTYLLYPRESSDLDLLLESLNAAPRSTDVDVVIGARGPIAPPELCNGLMLPVVFVDQVYSFDVDSLINSIPRPTGVSQKDFAPMAEEVFGAIMQLADNAGNTDEHRALNYLAVRYDGIYSLAASRTAEAFSLSGVDVRSSRLGGGRKVMDVIFSYRDRTTDVLRRDFVRVDVTEEFPFLISRLAPFYESQ